MSDVTYKVRVNRPCRLFIDDEEIMVLEESQLTKINLPKGEHLRKVVAVDNSAIYDEAAVVITNASKLDIIILDTTELKDAKQNTLPNGIFKVGDLYFLSSEDRLSVRVTRNKEDLYIFDNVNIPEQIVYRGYIYPVTSIGFRAFDSCSLLTLIKYTGTKEQWEKIEKHGTYWKRKSSIQIIYCTDGEISVKIG